MRITIQLTSHADPKRGETERLAEFVTLEFSRNGQARDAFLRDLVDDIKGLAKEHNARFKLEHPQGAH